jgi:hypothetical protein
MKNINSELKVIASENLDVSKDLEQEDQNLQETLKAYETKSSEIPTDQ